MNSNEDSSSLATTSHRLAIRLVLIYAAKSQKNKATVLCRQNEVVLLP